MSNEFKRTPTCGENDVDLRVATEPRRVTDAVLSQIIATKDGEIAALTAEVTHLAEKLAERDALLADIEFAITGAAPGSKLGSLLVRIHDLQRSAAAPQPVDALHKDVEWLVESAEMARTNPGLATQIRANCKAGSAPQPVDAAQAVPEAQPSETPEITRARLVMEDAKRKADARPYGTPGWKALERAYSNAIIAYGEAVEQRDWRPVAQPTGGCMMTINTKEFRALLDAYTAADDDDEIGSAFDALVDHIDEVIETAQIAQPTDTTKPLTRCAAGRDGECGHAQCPQLRDGEPVASGRHCPLDTTKGA